MYEIHDPIVFDILADIARGNPACSVRGTNVIYTNGVNTQEREALETLKRLRTLNITSSLDQYPESSDFILKYNFHYGFAADFLESAVQRFPSGFLSAVGVTNPYAAYMFFKTTSLMSQFGNDLALIVQASIDLHRDFMAKYKVEDRYLTDLGKLQESYSENLDDGYRVLAISHSQGGLFMEDAYDLLGYTRKYMHFAGLQVATPVLVSGIPKHKYVTHDKDRLINALYLLVGTLPSNFEAPMIIHNEYTNSKDYLLDFVLNHGMYSTYLYEPTIKNFVKQSIIDSALMLESNCPIAKFSESILDKTISLDSLDLDDPLVSKLNYLYEWDFGDGTRETSLNKVVKHTYQNPGSYTIKLRVTNEDGRDFGELAKTQKIINITTSISGGCMSEKGKYHLNPDGSIGGFVSDSSTVASTAYVGALVSVCQNSQILGSSRVLASKTTPMISDNLANTTIIDSNIEVGDIELPNSFVSNSSIKSSQSFKTNNMTIINTEISAGTIYLVGNKIENSIISSSMNEGSAIFYNVNFFNVNFYSDFGMQIQDVSINDKQLNSKLLYIMYGVMSVDYRDGTSWSGPIEAFTNW